MSNVCQHGQLKRQCELCERDKEIERLQDMLIVFGAFDEHPCFICGYDGPGYYQPNTHECAARYHKLVRGL